jgi:hypothetical protein
VQCAIVIGECIGWSLNILSQKLYFTSASQNTKVLGALYQSLDYIWPFWGECRVSPAAYLRVLALQILISRGFQLPSVWLWLEQAVYWWYVV